MTAVDGPNIQLYMTYKEESASCEVSEELMSWIGAKCDELEVCAPAFLLGCAELVREME